MATPRQKPQAKKAFDAIMSLGEISQDIDRNDQRYGPWIVTDPDTITALKRWYGTLDNLATEGDAMATRYASMLNWIERL